MQNNNQNKPNNYLNEYSYKILQDANKTAWYILKDFIYQIRYEMIQDYKKYINNLYKVNKLLDNLERLGKRNYQLVEYALDLSVNEVNIRFDGTREIYRYYYKDAGIRIFNVVYYKDYLFKSTSKKMLKFLTAEGKKARDKIKDTTSNKFNKLQEDVFSFIDNDPTLEDRVIVN